MDPVEIELARRELEEAGIPRWAPVGSSDARNERLYLWVDDDGAIRSALVDGAEREALEGLLDECRQHLAGTAERRPGTPPPDLQVPTALLYIGHGMGHGPLHRRKLRPLVDLLRVAEEELERLSSK